MSLISLETKIKFSVEDLKVYKQYLQAEIQTVENIINEKSKDIKTEYVSTVSLSIKNEEAKKNKLNLIKQLRTFYAEVVKLQIGLVEAKEIVDNLFISDLCAYTIIFPAWVNVTPSQLSNYIDKIGFRINSFD